MISSKIYVILYYNFKNFDVVLIKDKMYNYFNDNQITFRYFV